MLVALTGKQNSGKDHICSIIQEIFPTAIRLAFGDVLKNFMAEVYGFTRQDIEAMKRETTSMMYCSRTHRSYTMRELLQNSGMAVRKVLGDNVWIDEVLPLDLNHKGNVYVVTDVRMDNEAERVKDLYGAIWQVERLGEIRDYHITESGITQSLVDAKIYNTTENEVKLQLAELFKEELGHVVNL